MSLLRFKALKSEKLAPLLQEKVGGSRKGIRKLLEQNSCRVNGKVERFGSSLIAKGSVIEFTEEKALPKAEWTLLFENESLKVFDKPAGWVCSEENCKKTFSGELYLAHRLDKDTTGALLFGKTKEIREELMDLFRKREVEKEYLALVDGHPREDTFSRKTYLCPKKSFDGQTIYGSGPKGKLAITHFQVLEKRKDSSLVHCFPVTGRTHQIRVHLSELGHPILVDRQYAKFFRSTIRSSRPLLHSFRLNFFYRGSRIDVKSESNFFKNVL